MVNKVKIVAIAKDEGAYLVDWIFHHLYFGFSTIDIYVNRTSDNTLNIADKFEALPQVRFLNGDVFLKEDNRSFQTDVYLSAFQGEKSSDVTHILFLDVDEFWTPLNFTDDIITCLSKVNGDVISFEWLLKTDEELLFKPPFTLNNTGSKGRFVKSLSSVSLNVRSVQAHNVHADHADYRLADGSVFTFENWKNGRISETEAAKPLKNYFIVHRIYRSQKEYLSLLARGRPSSNMRFKDNRGGYLKSVSNKEVEWSITEEALIVYEKEKTGFIERYFLKEEITKGQCFVEERYQQVIELIASANHDEAEFLSLALRNIDIPDVLTAYATALKNLLTNRALKGSDVVTLRKVAFTIAESHPKAALQLLELAQQQRDKTPIIDERIKELKLRLNAKFN